MSTSALPYFAPHTYVGWSVRIVSVIRAIWVLCIAQNPLVWFFREGRQNLRADMEGPFYVIGAPDRQYGEGKAVLATIEELKRYPPFLLTLTVKSPDGEPIPHARFRWWQANTDGDYSYSSYALRGTFTTDAEGNVEILTVVPGAYGPKNHPRAGHFHFIVDGPGRRWQQLTTQLYICPSNDPVWMKPDLVNYLRAARTGNMLECWSAPTATASSGNVEHMSFPLLTPDDTDAARRLEWWNADLAETASANAPKVVAGGQSSYTLSKRSGWFGI